MKKRNPHPPKYIPEPCTVTLTPKAVAGPSAAGFARELEVVLAGIKAITDPCSEMLARISGNNDLAASIAGIKAVTDPVAEVLARISRNNGLAASIAGIKAVADPVAEVLARISRNNDLAASIAGIKAVAGPVAEVLARMGETPMFSAVLVAQQKMAALDSLALGRLAGIDTASSKLLKINFGNFTRSYQSLLAAASNDESLFEHVPVITTYSHVEYCREVELLESISVEADRTENDGGLVIAEAISQSVLSVDALLANFDDRLCPLLQGARAAVMSDNPDRGRHVTTSLRELITTVLHALAPDDCIRQWSTDKRHFSNNRPTRRARIEYVHRHINADPLTRFVEKDVQSILLLFELLQVGTHGVESRFTDSQLDFMLQRTESFVGLLISTSQSEQ